MYHPGTPGTGVTRSKSKSTSSFKYGYRVESVNCQKVTHIKFFIEQILYRYFSTTYVFARGPRCKTVPTCTSHQMPRNVLLRLSLPRPFLLFHVLPFFSQSHRFLKQLEPLFGHVVWRDRSLYFIHKITG